MFRLLPHKGVVAEYVVSTTMESRVSNENEELLFIKFAVFLGEIGR